MNEAGANSALRADAPAFQPSADARSVCHPNLPLCRLRLETSAKFYTIQILERPYRRAATENHSRSAWKLNNYLSCFLAGFLSVSNVGLDGLSSGILE